MRRKLIAANWKMNKRVAEAEQFADELRPLLPGVAHCDLVVFPSFFCVRPFADAVSGTSVAVGAQDLHWEPGGAFTGEVSAAMIRDAGASHVLAGHSERRHGMGEDDATVGRKLAAALDAGLVPVLCVGETLDEREGGREREVVCRQLDAAFDGRAARDAVRALIAYEPVWAIGTGRNATPADAEAMHRAVREWLGNRFGAEAAGVIRILYGGSAKPENAAQLMASPEIDGLLVGGASLAPASFAAIARVAPGA